MQRISSPSHSLYLFYENALASLAIFYPSVKREICRTPKHYNACKKPLHSIKLPNMILPMGSLIECNGDFVMYNVMFVCMKQFFYR